MVRTQVWILGGGTLVAGAAVALWLALSAREALIPGPSSLIPQAAPTQAPVAANRPEAPQEQAAPSFDVVRLSVEGEALVAGRAAPGAAITLRVDGEVVAQAAADPSGQFVALFSLGFSEAMQVMTLEMADAQGSVVESSDTVMLTPRPGPIASQEPPLVAALAPEATPADATPAPDEGDPANSGQLPAPLVQLAEAPEAVAGEGAVEASAGADGAAVEAVVAQPPAAPQDADAVATQLALAPEAGAATPLASESGTAAVESPSQHTGAATDSAARPQSVTPSAEAQPGGNAAGQAAEAPAAVAADTGTGAGAQTRTDAGPPGDSAAVVATAEGAAPTAILLRGDGGVTVLDAAPRIMDNVVIDAISYSDAGDVQISGRAAGSDPSGSLRIYLDNRPVALARAELGDWALDLPSVDAGIYTLRVDQLNAEGGVVSRFETPFLRESREALAEVRARTEPGPSAATDLAQAGVPARDAAAPAAVPSATEAAATSSASPERGASADASVAPAAAAGDAALPAAPSAQVVSAGPVDAPAPPPASATAAADPVQPPAATAAPADAGAGADTGTTAATAAPADTAATAATGTTANTAAPVATAATAAPGIAARPAEVTREVPRASLITVQPGHTLWAISRDRYGQGDRYMVIFNANRGQIRDPDLIYPGQVFALPDARRGN